MLTSEPPHVRSLHKSSIEASMEALSHIVSSVPCTENREHLQPNYVHPSRSDVVDELLDLLIDTKSPRLYYDVVEGLLQAVRWCQRNSKAQSRNAVRILTVTHQRVQAKPPQISAKSTCEMPQAACMKKRKNLKKVNL